MNMIESTWRINNELTTFLTSSPNPQVPVSGKKVSTEVLLKRIEHLEEQMAIKAEAMLWVQTARLVDGYGVENDARKLDVWKLVWKTAI